LHNFYAIPIRVQFIRHNPWQPRAIPTPHLRTVADDENCPFRIDGNVHSRLKSSIRHGGAGVGPSCNQQAFWQELRTYNERPRACYAFQETSPAHVFNMDHEFT
jgi:hypothetical protein